MGWKWMEGKGRGGGRKVETLSILCAPLVKYLIYRFISEMIQDRVIVTVECE